MPSIIMCGLGKLSAYMPVYKKPTWSEVQIGRALKGSKPRKTETYRCFRRNFQARWMREEAKLKRQTSENSLVELQLMQDHRREFPELWW